MQDQSRGAHHEIEYFSATTFGRIGRYRDRVNWESLQLLGLKFFAVDVDLDALHSTYCQKGKFD